MVRDVAGGSHVSALTPDQARDALAAFERLETFRMAADCLRHTCLS
jgi:hypothetical protein